MPDATKPAPEIKPPTARQKLTAFHASGALKAAAELSGKCDAETAALLDKVVAGYCENRARPKRFKGAPLPPGS